MRSNFDLYCGSLFLIFLSSIFLFAGWIHLQPVYRPSLIWFKDAETRLNHHLSGLFGISSIAWSGHLIHVSIPESRGQHIGWENLLLIPPYSDGLKPFFSLNWMAYSEVPDSVNHIFGTSTGSGTAILTFLGGFHPQTKSLWISDMAHHHLAIV